MKARSRITEAHGKKAARRWRGSLPTLLTLLSFLGFPSISSANTIYVTSLTDKISSTGGCSLKEAIYASNFQESIAVTGYASDGTPQKIATQCNAGSGDDTIVLPTLALLQFDQITNDAQNFAGPTATPIVTAAKVVIEANGATLQRIGSVNMRLFAVAAGTHLTINNAHIKDFVAQGGNGADGGGGGLGAGGAIFVGVGTTPGALIVENSTFEANFAIGGNGSTCPPANPFNNCVSGGGGGGMGGNGGAGDVDDNFGGGGGGGARGNGGSGPGGSGGGGGGGTVVSGGNASGSTNAGGAAGLFCGGRGGDASDDGNDGSSASCPGGGGGGGGQAINSLNPLGTISGGSGGTGGGGGGGPDQGGNGGWGGGGGSASVDAGNGGNGGFGGGGGAAHDNISSLLGKPGNPGVFGGSADSLLGGGGAGLGGAIFNNNSSVVIQNSTFTANDAVGGRKGDPADTGIGTGEGHGGAIFAANGSTRILNVTIDGNLSSGTGGGIYIWQDPDAFAFLLGTNTTTFVLRNTIIADSAGSDDAANNQCTMNASVVTGGDWRGNLIQNDDASFPCDYAPPQPSGIVSTAEPLLGPLQNNQGLTPTMAITERSPAWNSADASTSEATDQRGQGRPSNGGFDIGAFELCLTGLAPVQRPCIISAGLEGGGGESFEDLTIQVSSAAAGTTNPVPGTYGPQIDTVTVVSATANPGYIFLNWTGNLADPTNPTTTVIMDQPQTITANFSPCTCAGDVSGSVSVTRGPIGLNPVSRRYNETVTITNNSAHTITGPISLVLDNLTANATLFNSAGTTTSLESPAGSPYVNAAVNLAPGLTISMQLQFTDPTNTAISYTTRVLAGPGSR